MKSETEWQAMEQELNDLRQWRKELREDLVRTSKRIHIMATSIRQHKAMMMQKEVNKC